MDSVRIGIALNVVFLDRKMLERVKEVVLTKITKSFNISSPFRVKS